MRHRDRKRGANALINYFLFKKIKNNFFKNKNVIHIKIIFVVVCKLFVNHN